MSASPAVEFEGTVVDHGDLADLTARAAGALLDAGARPGDRVAVWALNDIATVVALRAVAHIGAVAVPINTRLTRDEAAARVAAAGARFAVAPHGAPDLELEPLRPSDLDGPPVPMVEPGADDGVVAIVFTSGTAGPGKGVVITRRNIAAAVQASASRIGNGPADAWLAVLPLFHVGGLAVLWRSDAAGGRVVLHRRFDPDRVAAALAERRVTVASLVPTMLRGVLAAHPGPYRGSRAVLLGGGAVDPGLVQRGLDAGLPILTTYGMTETTSQAATVVPGSERESVGTAGVALDGVQIRVVDAAGAPLRGSMGVIEVRGASVSPGYLGEVPRGPSDWFRTGDIGRIDEAGRLVVAGRADEVIVTGGENVHPAEVESALAALPGVADAAVFGVADDDWGMVVAAAIVPSAGSDPEPDELGLALRGHLAGFKVPSRFVFVEELPRNAVGKVDRDALATIAGRGRDGTV